jgi:hypothetical protein
MSSAATAADKQSGTFGDRINLHPHLHLLVTEGGADEQVMVRYYGLYANAHRGKVRKTRLASSPLRIVEEELRHFPAKGWADRPNMFYDCCRARKERCARIFASPRPEPAGPARLSPAAALDIASRAK